MKVQVIDDNDNVLLSSRDGVMVTFEMGSFKAAANALHEVQALLSQDHHVIASIKADISTVIGRIEHELGAHPAFTWAQTKLGNAAAHLEAYVAGTWEEPKPFGVTLDNRGVPVSTEAHG